MPAKGFWEAFCEKIFTKSPNACAKTRLVNQDVREDPSGRCGRLYRELQLTPALRLCNNATSGSTSNQRHAGEIAFADLDDRLESRGEHAPGILDHLAIDLDRALLELAIGL